MNTIIQFASVGLLFLSSCSIEAGRTSLRNARRYSAGNRRADGEAHTTDRQSARKSTVPSSSSTSLSTRSPRSLDYASEEGSPRADDSPGDESPAPQSRSSKDSDSPQTPAGLSKSARRRARKKERAAALERELAAFKAAKKTATPGEVPPVKAEETPAPAAVVVDGAAGTGASAAGKGSVALAYDPKKKVLVDGTEMTMEDAVTEKADPNSIVTVDGQPIAMGRLQRLKSPPPLEYDPEKPVLVDGKPMTMAEAAAIPDATQVVTVDNRAVTIGTLQKLQLPPPPSTWQRFKKAATPQSLGGAATAVAGLGSLAALGMAGNTIMEEKNDEKVDDAQTEGINQLATKAGVSLTTPIPD